MFIDGRNMKIVFRIAFLSMVIACCQLIDGVISAVDKKQHPDVGLNTVRFVFCIEWIEFII